MYININKRKCTQEMGTKQHGYMNPHNYVQKKNSRLVKIRTEMMSLKKGEDNVKEVRLEKKNGTQMRSALWRSRLTTPP